MTQNIINGFNIDEEIRKVGNGLLWKGEKEFECFGKKIQFKYKDETNGEPEVVVGDKKYKTFGDVVLALIEDQVKELYNRVTDEVYMGA